MTYTPKELERMKISLGITDDGLDERVKKLMEEVEGRVISVCAYKNDDGNRLYAAKIPNRDDVLTSISADNFAMNCHIYCKFTNIVRDNFSSFRI